MIIFTSPKIILQQKTSVISNLYVDITEAKNQSKSALFSAVIRDFCVLAEREGFEPSDGYKPSHDFQSCALDQLSHLSVNFLFK